MINDINTAVARQYIARQYRRTWNVGNLVASHDVTISGPIRIGNNYIRSRTIKQSLATIAFDINKPLLQSLGTSIQFIELSARTLVGCRAANNDVIIAILLTRDVALSISPELFFDLWCSSII